MLIFNSNIMPVNIKMIIYVTVHGKTYVNDLSLKRKNQRTTNECSECFYELPGRSINLEWKIRTDKGKNSYDFLNDFVIVIVIVI